MIEAGVSHVNDLRARSAGDILKIKFVLIDG